eukprot:scaffold256_cov261-Pinguiococcus_pyrenoidosus.AAC.38
MRRDFGGQRTAHGGTDLYNVWQAESRSHQSRGQCNSEELVERQTEVFRIWRWQGHHVGRHLDAGICVDRSRLDGAAVAVEVYEKSVDGLELRGVAQHDLLDHALLGFAVFRCAIQQIIDVEMDLGRHVSGICGLVVIVHHPILLEAAVVHPTIVEDEHAKPMLHIHLPLPVVDGSIGIPKDSVALAIPICPLPGVRVAHLPVYGGQAAWPLLQPHVGADAVLLAVGPLAFIALVQAEPVHGALAVFFIREPLSFVDVAAGVREPALAFACVVHPLPYSVKRCKQRSHTTFLPFFLSSFLPFFLFLLFPSPPIHWAMSTHLRSSSSAPCHTTVCPFRAAGLPPTRPGTLCRHLRC